MHLQSKKKVFVHRDFHVSNLMKFKNKIGVIDSQDALIGNGAYDLASLIDDVRFKTDKIFKDKIYRYYLKLNKKRVNEATLLSDFEILSILRNMKIIGIFTRLALRDKKKQYLKLIPYAWKLIELRISNNKKFSELKSLLDLNFSKKIRNQEMKIKTALILCAGYGKRLNPITLTTPKPLLKINEITLLENCINLIHSLGINKILINTFYLSEKIEQFLKDKKFNLEIKIINDGSDILNTGGGILNMINSSNETDFITFNPDTVWNENYKKYIKDMEKFYFLNKVKNILLLANENLSFDKNLRGDFNLKKNIIKKDELNRLIYTGCQILNKSLFDSYEVRQFFNFKYLE